MTQQQREDLEAIKADPAAAAALHVDSIVAAKYLGLSPKTLEIWRSRGEGRGPKFRRFGVCVRYRVGDLLAWADGNAVQVGGERAAA